MRKTMKINLILGIAVIVLGYVTCKNIQKTQDQTPPPAASKPVSEESGLAWKTSKVVHGDNPNSAYSHQSTEIPRHVDVPWDKITKATTSRRAFMSTGWWTAKMAYQPTDTTVHVNYLNKWFLFAEDQSFKIYIDGKEVDNGHWAFDDDKKIMYISCNDTYFNNSWALQERGFRMIWRGNTDLNITGIQIRMDNFPTPPWTQK